MTSVITAELRVQGPGFKDLGLGFRVEGLGSTHPPPHTLTQAHTPRVCVSVCKVVKGIRVEVLKGRGSGRVCG